MSITLYFLLQVQFDMQVMNEGIHQVERQNCLRSVTGQRTVPIIYVGRHLIGGYADMMEKLTDTKDSFVNILEKQGVYHTFAEYEQPFNETEADSAINEQTR